MKYFAFVLLLGFTSASSDTKLDKAADENGMQNSPPLNQDIPFDHRYANKGDDETMVEMIKSLQNILNQNFDQAKTDIGEGDTIREEFLDKTKEQREQLKNVNVNPEDKTSRLFDNAMGLAMNLINTLQRNKQSAGAKVEDNSNTFDPEYLIETMGNILGQDSQLLNQFYNLLNGKGTSEMMNAISSLLAKDKGTQDGMNSIWEKAGSYLKDLKNDNPEDNTKFGEGVKNAPNNQFTRSNDIFENIKNIAQRFLKSGVGKDIKDGAEELLRKYKEDL